MPASSLTLNIAPIQFGGGTVPAHGLPFESGEALRELRSSLRGKAFVKRIGNEILVVPQVEGVEIPGSPARLDLSKEPWLVTDLAGEAILQWCWEKKMPSPGYDPLHIPKGGPNTRSLLAEASGRTAAPEWMSIGSRTDIWTRSIRIGGADVPALVIDLDWTYPVDLTCQDMVVMGFDIRGLYVGRYEPSDHPHLAPRFRLVGRVDSIAGERLILGDTKGEAPELMLPDAHLEPTKGTFRRCLDFHYGPEKAKKVWGAVDDRLAEFRQGKAKLSHLEMVRSSISKQGLFLAPGIPFTLGPFLDETSGTFAEVRETTRPVYIFDRTGSKTDTFNERGLSKHGPYTSSTFTPSIPHVCVICQASRQGDVEKFLAKFKGGIRIPNLDRQPFEQGFVRKYRLRDIEVDLVTAAGSRSEDYANAARKALLGAQQGRPYDLAIIQTEESTLDLRGDDNPYLVAKAAFLTHGVPTQAFQIEKALRSDYDLAFILNTMALATYSKLGGVPWLLQADPTIHHEFVVGLGSAYVGSGRLGVRERIVGITSVFNGDGRYMLSNLSNAVPILEYPSVLLESLRLTIERVRKEMAWLPHERVRIIFHAFKPANRVELDAVVALMSELGDFEVQFAFLHVMDQHPYVLFDPAVPGLTDRRTKKLKGEYAAKRGLILSLSEREAFITTTGVNELKRPTDGLPRPIQIALHPDSTFTDLKYLSQQVYAFACHSWRDFKPTSMPVTVMYSDLVARQLSRLSRLSKWDGSVMLGRIGTTRWFL